MDVQDIIDYENGELGASQTLRLFGSLIQSGAAWTLQGSYGRQAQSFIDNGLISDTGDVDWDEANYYL